MDLTDPRGWSRAMAGRQPPPSFHPQRPLPRGPGSPAVSSGLGLRGAGSAPSGLLRTLRLCCPSSSSTAAPRRSPPAPSPWGAPASSVLRSTQILPVLPHSCGPLEEPSRQEPKRLGWGRAGAPGRLLCTQPWPERDQTALPAKMPKAASWLSINSHLCAWRSAPSHSLPLAKSTCAPLPPLTGGEPAQHRGISRPWEAPKGCLAAVPPPNTPPEAKLRSATPSTHTPWGLAPCRAPCGRERAGCGQGVPLAGLSHLPFAPALFLALLWQGGRGHKRAFINLPPSVCASPMQGGGAPGGGAITMETGHRAHICCITKPQALAHLRRGGGRAGPPRGLLYLGKWGGVGGSQGPAVRGAGLPWEAGRGLLGGGHLPGLMNWGGPTPWGLQEQQIQAPLHWGVPEEEAAAASGSPLG